MMRAPLDSASLMVAIAISHSCSSESCLLRVSQAGSVKETSCDALMEVSKSGRSVSLLRIPAM